MAASSKKRKAQILDEGSPIPIRKRKNTVRKQVNGSKSSLSPNTDDNNSHDAENGGSTLFDAQKEEILFQVKCPAASDIGKKRKSKADIFGPVSEDGGFSELQIKYTITPGSEWSNLRQYRNFIVGEQKFSMGETVFINHSSALPQIVPDDSDDLAFDRENNWIAKVLEVRAKDPQHVYLRVFWLYWPEELPHGREPYHGESEVVMSNHMEVVDAMTVAGRADVTRWNELDADEEMGHLFWRQFYDVRQKGQLSVARRHCICNEHYNPDKVMLKCPSSSCGVWLHEECLIDDILEKTYQRLMKGEQSPNGEIKASESTLVKKALFPAEKLKELVTNSRSSKKDNQPESEGKGESFGSLKKTSKGRGTTVEIEHAHPWEGKLTATIKKNTDREKQGRFEITDMREQDPKTWYEDIKCLKCETVLD